MDTPIRTYIVYYILPTLILSIIIIISFYVIGFSSFVPSPIFIIASLIPTIIVIMYPFIVENRKTIQIESNFPMLVTQITVISYTSTNRVDIFRKVAKDSNYDALSEEIGELVGMIETFNMSLDDAARRRSKIVTSDLLADFYEKLAYNLGSGNSLNSFLISEQQSVKDMYGSRYEARLSNLETISELFLSANLASTFLLVFASISPVLTGINPVIMITSVFFFYIMIQFAFIVLINAQSPKDKLWYIDYEDNSSIIRKIQIYTVACSLLSLFILYLLTQLYQGIPIYPKLIVSVLPMIVPSYIHIKKERQIDSLENQFSSFIRGLGNVESVKKTSTVDVLSNLKEKDFGELKPYIKRLYRRLFIGIDRRKSWSLFNSEINSYIIKEFTDMYVTGRELGGNPKKIGQIVSDNYRHLSKLRKKRKTETRNFIGYAYGMTVAWSSTVFITVYITEILVSITNSSTGEIAGDILSVATYNVGLIQSLIYAFIIVNIVIVSFMIRISQRKIITGVVIHIMFLTILSFGIGWGIEYAMDRFVNVETLSSP